MVGVKEERKVLFSLLRVKGSNPINTEYTVIEESYGRDAIKALEEAKKMERVKKREKHRQELVIKRQQRQDLLLQETQHQGQSQSKPRPRANPSSTKKQPSKRKNAQYRKRKKKQNKARRKPTDIQTVPLQQANEAEDQDKDDVDVDADADGDGDAGQDDVDVDADADAGKDAGKDADTNEGDIHAGNDVVIMTGPTAVTLCEPPMITIPTPTPKIIIPTPTPKIPLQSPSTFPFPLHLDHFNFAALGNDNHIALYGPRPLRLMNNDVVIIYTLMYRINDHTVWRAKQAVDYPQDQQAILCGFIARQYLHSSFHIPKLTNMERKDLVVYQAIVSHGQNQKASIIDVMDLKRSSEIPYIEFRDIDQHIFSVFF
jgi:hypothetical protein